MDSATVADLRAPGLYPGEAKGLIDSYAERDGHDFKDLLAVDDLELIAGRQVRELVHDGASSFAPFFLTFCFMIASTPNRCVLAVRAEGQRA